MTTTTSFDIARLRTGAHRSWSAARTTARTLAQESAARRQARRERASLDRQLAMVGDGQDAVSRELRAMVLVDFERTA